MTVSWESQLVMDFQEKARVKPSFAAGCIRPQQGLGNGK